MGELWKSSLRRWPLNKYLTERRNKLWKLPGEAKLGITSSKALIQACTWWFCMMAKSLRGWGCMSKRERNTACIQTRTELCIIFNSFSFHSSHPIQIMSFRFLWNSLHIHASFITLLLPPSIHLLLFIDNCKLETDLGIPHFNKFQIYFSAIIMIMVTT